MILLLKSSGRPRYARENLTTLGWPPGFRMRTDYATQWIDPALLQGGVDLPAPTLILFSNDDASRVLPVRQAVLEQVSKRGGVAGLVLRLGPFVHASGKQEPREVLERLLGSQALTPPDSHHVRLAPEELSAELGLETFELSDDDGHTLWQQKVDWLRALPETYRGAVFVYLQGLWDANESRFLAPEDLREFHPGQDSGYVVYPEQHYECHFEVLVPEFDDLERSAAGQPRLKAVGSPSQVSFPVGDGEAALPKYGSLSHPTLVFIRPGVTRIQIDLDHGGLGPVFNVPFKVLGSVPERRSPLEERPEEDFMEIQSRLEDWYAVRDTDDPQVKKDRLERANFALGLVLAEYGRACNEASLVRHKLKELYGYLKRYEHKPDEDRVERIVRLAQGLWRRNDPDAYYGLILRAKELYPHNVHFSRELSVFEAQRDDGRDRARDNLWHVFRHVEPGAYSADLPLLWELVDHNNQYVWDAYAAIFEKHAVEAARLVVEDQAEWASEPRVFIERGVPVACELLGRSTLPDTQRLAVFKAMLTGLIRLGDSQPATLLIRTAFAQKPLVGEASRQVAEVLLARSRDGGFARMLNEIFPELVKAANVELLEALEVFSDSMLSTSNEMALYEAFVEHPDTSHERRTGARLELYERVRTAEPDREEALYQELLAAYLADGEFQRAAQFATEAAGNKPERYSDLAGILLLEGENNAATEAFRHAMEVHRARGERVAAAEALRSMLLLQPEDEDELQAELDGIERAMSSTEKAASERNASELEGRVEFARAWKLLVVGAGPQMKTWATPRLEAMGAELDWYVTEKKRGLPMEQIEGRIRGSIDGVLIITAFIGHNLAHQVHEACRLSETPYVDVGLRGVSRILAVAKSDLEPRMLARREEQEAAKPKTSKRKSRRKSS